MGLMSMRDTHLMGSLLLASLSVFIVGTANFYNFMDGINGIAGITGVVGFLLLAVYGHGAGSDSVYNVLSVAMACSCAGFLPFNIPRAKVFMGDVGSVLLGFVFACLVVLLSASFFDFICMTAFLFPFYADELTTMAIRIRDGDKLSQAHRKHVYQLLANEYGIDHWKVSLGYGVVQLIIGCVVFVIRNNDLASLLSFLAVCFFFLFCFLWAYVLKLPKRVYCNLISDSSHTFKTVLVFYEYQFKLIMCLTLFKMPKHFTYKFTYAKPAFNSVMFDK